MPGEGLEPAATTSSFRREQRGVAIGMGAALGIAVIALGLAVWAGKGTAVDPFAERLQWTLRADGFVVIWLVATVANVARQRFFSEQDIAGSGSTDASDRVRMASAITQNSLEQTVIAIGAHLVVTATFDASQTIVATLVALFCLGRLLFWAGYSRGAHGRALGFALTFYPSVLALVASLGALTFT
ncbi:MAPEG family protein [Novosphingobium sp. 9U]|uniref:MAPEG family protein n=1 Tax=Novosphingobium sp. 9U TaxID=2653158 RepID=UPI0012F021BB|nr:MAPEG family protein [Novosphingobium sp. 9U]VWX51371.1 MAPEG family protein [Novosphingobium sp. 9U]